MLFEAGSFDRIDPGELVGSVHRDWDKQEPLKNGTVRAEVLLGGQYRAGASPGSSKASRFPYTAPQAPAMALSRCGWEHDPGRPTGAPVWPRQPTVRRCLRQRCPHPVVSTALFLLSMTQSEAAFFCRLAWATNSNGSLNQSIRSSCGKTIRLMGEGQLAPESLVVRDSVQVRSVGAVEDGPLPAAEEEFERLVPLAYESGHLSSRETFTAASFPLQILRLPLKRLTSFQPSPPSRNSS